MPATLATCSASRPWPTFSGTLVSTSEARWDARLASALLRLPGVADEARVGLGSALLEQILLLILAIASAPSLVHAHGTPSMRQP